MILIRRDICVWQNFFWLPCRAAMRRIRKKTVPVLPNFCFAGVEADRGDEPQANEVFLASHERPLWSRVFPNNFEAFNMQGSSISRQLPVLISTLILLSNVTALPTQAQSIREFLKSPGNSMQLLGDGADTTHCQLVLKDGYLPLNACKVYLLHG